MGMLKINRKILTRTDLNTSLNTNTERLFLYSYMY